MRKLIWACLLAGLLSCGVATASLLTGSASVQTFTYVVPARTFVQSVTVPTVTVTVSGSTSTSPSSAPVASSGWWDARTAALDPAGSSLLQTWLGYAVVNPNMPFGSWAVATGDASSGDPTYTVPLVKQGGTITSRIKLGTRPDPSGDGHLTVRDLDAGVETDFWQAFYDPTSQRISSASAAVSFPAGSVNEQTTGWGGDAANLALRRWLIRPEEISAGVITHPLSFGNPLIGTGSPRYPAIHNAPTGPAGHLVEGTWLRLDPAYDVTQLSGWQRTVATALQRYGMFLRDSSGSLAVYAENTVNRGGSTPWTQAGFSGTAAMFSASFPWSHMQVLAPPPALTP